jgi:glycine cleavage system protein P-like pyridoxal-binding family
MPDKPTDVTLDILRKIQDGMVDLRDRLERVEGIVRKHRHDAAAMMVIMRATAGDFDERVNEVVECVAALEARTS